MEKQELNLQEKIEKADRMARLISKIPEDDRDYPYVTALPDKTVYVKKLRLRELDDIPRASDTNGKTVSFSLRKELERRVEEELETLEELPFA